MADLTTLQKEIKASANESNRIMAKYTKKIANYTWWLAVATVVNLAATVTICVFNYFQISAANKQANAAIATLQMSTQQFRANVAATINSDDKLLQSITPTIITLYNYGQTTAFNVFQQTNGSLVDTNFDKYIPPDFMKPNTILSIRSGNLSPSATQIIHVFTDPPVDEFDIKEFNNGKKIYVTIGKTTYRDQSSKEHYNNFCFLSRIDQISKRYVYDACPLYNDSN